MSAAFENSAHGTGQSPQTDGLSVSRSVSETGADQPIDWAHSEATRYLCVGAYLDRTFRRRVLRTVLNSQHRAVAPSYGVDIVPVIRHCLRAQRRDFLVNLALVALLWMAAVINLGAVVWVVLFALVLSILGVAGRGAGRVPGRSAGLPPVARMWLLLLVGPFLVLLFLRPLLSAGRWDKLVPDGGGPNFAGQFLLVFLLLGLAWAIWFGGLVINQTTILAELSPGRFDPGAAPVEPPRYTGRLAYLAEAQKGNVTYFSRQSAHRPFVGSGQAGHPMALTVPLVRAKDENGEEKSAPISELTVQALYRRMRQAMVKLADPANPPAERVQGLSMQRRVFVPGLLRPDDGLLDPATKQPRHWLNRDELDRLVQYDRNRPTEYLAVRIGAWEGELEITVFLYFSIRGRTLYTEFVAAVLPAIRENYHHVDRAQQLDPVTYARMARISARQLPVEFVSAPREIVRAARTYFWGWFYSQSEVQNMRNQLAYDYGIRASVRELGTDFDSEDFFQFADAQRYIYLVETRLRDAVGEVLDDFGYSSQEFLDRAQFIIDNSVLISGGTFNANSLSVGARSKAQAWVSTRPGAPSPGTSPNPSAGRPGSAGGPS